MLTMSAETDAGLDYVRRVLAREFQTLSHAEIVDETEAIAARLLATARFDDYIPLLVHRFARDRLRKRLEVDSRRELESRMEVDSLASSA